MRKFTTLTTCLLILMINFFALKSNGLEQENPPVKIDKGTFFRVISPVEISSNLVDIGDDVMFINVSDMYINDTNAIPKDSKFLGIVEDVREPVQGTNASIKLKINKVITPDKKTIPVNAYVYSENDNYLGGEITPPMYYNRTPTYTEGWCSGVLQYTPSNIRFPGQYTVVKPGAEIFIMLTDDLKIN